MPDTKISDDAAVVSLVGTELIPLVVSGANKVFTPAQMKSFVNAGGLAALLAIGNATGSNYIQLTPETANRVLIADASKNIKTSSTPSAKLAYLDNLTADVQTQLNALTSLINAISSGQSWKDPCRAASTGNINIMSPGATIDGVTLATNDRILLKNQTNDDENGIYIWNGSAVPATRAVDADSASELASAAIVITEGTANADKIFICTNDATFTLNTDTVTFVERGGASYVGTAGRIVISAGSIDIAASYAGQNTITIVGTINTGTWQGNTIDAAYLDILPAVSAGTVVTFAKDTDFGTEASPETGNVSYSTSGAKVGVISRVIHNHTIAPTFAANMTKLSNSGDYVVGVINYIYCEYRNATKVIYSITQ